jgi:hypothetical protein
MGKDRWAVGLIGAIAGCLGAVLALDSFEHSRVRSQLQEVADSAALAGVLALASNPNQEAGVANRAATIAATQEVEKRTGPGAVAFLVKPSKSDDLTISVHLSEPELSTLHAFLYGAPPDVVGHANYSPPTDPQPQMANRLHGWKTYAQSEQQQ